MLSVNSRFAYLRTFDKSNTCIQQSAIRNFYHLSFPGWTGESRASSYLAFLHWIARLNRAMTREWTGDDKNFLAVIQFIGLSEEVDQMIRVSVSRTSAYQRIR